MCTHFANFGSIIGKVAIVDTAYLHSVLVKDKTGASFKIAADSVIIFYRSYGHQVNTIRCDAGSSENDSAAGTYLMSTHGVRMAPAAPGHQHQNFVERSVQTLIKGVSCLLRDQSSLTSKWWDYAVEHWAHVSNCLPHHKEWLLQPSSPQEIITKVASYISTKFLFPFGCPVTSIPHTTRLEISCLWQIRYRRRLSPQQQRRNLCLHPWSRCQTLSPL